MNYQLIERYISCLKAYNETTNIYSKKSYDKLEFHIEDSLKLASIIGNTETLVYDFGSGSGLPSIPIAIANPNNSVVAFESKSRKSNFLEHVADQLGLTNYTVMHENIVEHGRNSIETSDVITAKAFCPYERIDQYTKYFIKDGTRLYLPISQTQYDVYHQLNLPGVSLIVEEEGDKRFFYLSKTY